jgi:hypothetical protein
MGAMKMFRKLAGVKANGKRILQIEREFRCFACGRVDRYEPYAAPVCCAALMKAGEEMLYHGGDPEEGRIDAITLKKENWPHGIFENATAIVEIWFLRPGRYKGEKIGWMTDTGLAVHWRMVPGVTPQAGIALDRASALECMIAALDRG